MLIFDYRLGAGSVWSSAYRRFLERIENASYRRKLLSFEFVFFGSRVGLAGMVVLLQGQLERAILMPKPFPSPFNLMGFLLICTGIAIDLWSIRTFLTSGGGTPAYIAPPKRVVMEGPYARVRNPMYLSLFLTLLGFGIMFDAVLLLAIAFVSLLTVHFVIVLREEAGLEARFGKEYEEYKKRVPRWVPKFGSRSSEA